MSFSIKGTGSAYPKCVKSNYDLARLVDTSDEWIRTRTGIKERRVCTDETLNDLVLSAAKSALDNAEILAEDLDLIILFNNSARSNYAFDVMCFARKIRSKLCGV